MCGVFWSMLALLGDLGVGRRPGGFLVAPMGLHSFDQKSRFLTKFGGTFCNRFEQMPCGSRKKIGASNFKKSGNHRNHLEHPEVPGGAFWRCVCHFPVVVSNWNHKKHAFLQRLRKWWKLCFVDFSNIIKFPNLDAPSYFPSTVAPTLWAQTTLPKHPSYPKQELFAGTVFCPPWTYLRPRATTGENALARKVGATAYRFEWLLPCRLQHVMRNLILTGSETKNTIPIKRHQQLQKTPTTENQNVSNTKTPNQTQNLGQTAAQSSLKTYKNNAEQTPTNWKHHTRN